MITTVSCVCEFFPVSSTVRFAGVAASDTRKRKIPPPLQDAKVTAWRLRQVNGFHVSLLQLILLLCVHVSVRVTECSCTSGVMLLSRNSTLTTLSEMNGLIAVVLFLGKV